MCVDFTQAAVAQVVYHIRRDTRKFVMAAQEHGRPVASRLLHQLSQKHPRIGVEWPRWLIHEHKLRLHHECDDQRELLPHAARERRRISIAELCNAEGFQHALCPIRHLTLRTVCPQHEVDVLSRRQVLIERRNIGNESNLPADGARPPRKTLAQHINLAGARRHPSRQHLSSVVLPAPFGPVR